MRKYKFHVRKRKIADFFEPSEILFGQIQCLFNLTIFWVRENSIFLFRTQKSC